MSLPQPASLFKNVTNTSYTGELVGKTCQIFPSALPIKLPQDKDRIEKAMHDSETIITYPLLGSTEIPTGERAFCVTRVFLELPSSLATSILS